VDESEAALRRAARSKEPILEQFPKAARYKDFRVMLEKQKDIDAVIVATPDHTHAVVAMAAMQLGKHVYVQKPLTRTISEARALTEAARRYKVVTQMGNQGPLGRGRPADPRVDRGRRDRQGPRGALLDEPSDLAAGDARPTDSLAVPDGLDWDLWIGPRRCARTIAPTIPSAGGRGSTSAPARSATWPAT
jgi:hypothetical protein